MSSDIKQMEALKRENEFLKEQLKKEEEMSSDIEQLEALKRENEFLKEQLKKEEEMRVVEQMKRELEEMKRENASLKEQFQLLAMVKNNPRKFLEHLRSDKIPKSVHESFQEIKHAALELDACFNPEIIKFQQKDIAVLRELRDKLNSAAKMKEDGIECVGNGVVLTIAGYLGGLLFPTVGAVVKGVGLLGLFAGGVNAFEANFESDQVWLEARALVNKASRRFQPLGRAVLKLQHAYEKCGLQILPKDLEEVCTSSKDLAIIKSALSKTNTSMHFAIRIDIILRAFQVASSALASKSFPKICAAFTQILHIFISCNSSSSQPVCSATSRQEEMDVAIKQMSDQLDVMRSMLHK